METDDESLRVRVHDGDPDLKLTIFADSTPPLISEEQGLTVPPRDPEVVFSLRWVRIVYVILSAILKSRESKAILKAHACSRDDSPVYFRFLEKLGTTLYRGVGKAVCLHELTNRTLIGKADRVIVFDEVGTLHSKYNRPTTDGVTAEVVMSSAL